MDDGSRETVGVILDKLEMLGIPRELIYVSYSGGKGYHVETFFDEIVSTKALKNLYGHVIREGQLDPRKVEFRPTHGNAIKLPLSVHARTGNYCCFVDPVTFEPMETENYFFLIRQNHVPDIRPALTLPEITGKTSAETGKPKEEAHSDITDEGNSSGNIALACTGTRHDTMQRIAVYQRIQGTDREECRQILERWYAAQDPNTISSTPEEVRKDIDELLDWVFSERFKLPRKLSQKNAAFLSARQMYSILERSSRSERRIYFLLTLRYRMGQIRLSTASIGGVIGVSQTTVKHAINKLVQAGVISMVQGKRMNLGDGEYSCESNGYIVHSKWPYPDERQTEISMKELMSDFDQAYFSAIQF